MYQVHELKILPEYFEAINDGSKTFEIRKNDRDFKVGDCLLLKEFNTEKSKYTGYEKLQQVTYITDYAQQEGYVVMSIKEVPISFKYYLEMSKKEKAVFKNIIKHIHLYGTGDRDVTNTLWDIIHELIDNHELTETDQQWYMEYWDED